MLIMFSSIFVVDAKKFRGTFKIWLNSESGYMNFRMITYTMDTEMIEDKKIEKTLQVECVYIFPPILKNSDNFLIYSQKCSNLL